MVKQTSKLTRNPKFGNRTGVRDDLGQFFRSSMEANFARFLNFLKEHNVIEGWEYEAQTFYFAEFGYKTNPISYTPDFFIQFSPELNTKAYKSIKEIMPDAEPGKVLLVEVKGRETGRDRNKWKRLRKHTDHTLNVVKKPEMQAIKSMFGEYLEGWE